MNESVPKNLKPRGIVRNGRSYNKVNNGNLKITEKIETI